MHCLLKGQIQRWETWKSGQWYWK